MSLDDFDRGPVVRRQQYRLRILDDSDPFVYRTLNIDTSQNKLIPRLLRFHALGTADFVLTPLQPLAVLVT